MDKFRIQGKNFFLTYPKCDISIDQAYETLNYKNTIRYALIAQEKHKDGDLHLHAYIEYVKKLNIRDPKHFDLGDCHGNYQKPDNIEAVINYCKKENSFKEFGTRLLNQTTSQDIPDIYQLARELSRKKYFMECLRKKIPFQYAKEAWNDCDLFTINEDPEIGKIRSDLSELKWEEIENPRKSTVLIGPSGIGKTSWCKRECPKPALFVTHMDTLRQFKPNEHKCIIFDDMSFLHVPREAQIHITDKDDSRAIHVRYGIAEIPKGTPKIFTANNEIFTNDEAINRRLNKHKFI